jgi:multidrug resistance efflux pump
VVVVLVLYGALVYLLIFKFKVIPRNIFTRLAVLLIGIALAVWFLAGLRTLTPASSQAAITGRVVEIAPQVSGRIATVSAERNTVVEADTILFTIDPTMYQARVNELQTRIQLSRKRLQQFEELASKSAGSLFQLQQGEAELRQLEAQLTAAKFDLDNTKVRAPFRGMVPKMLLKEGMQVSPSRSVMAFVDTDELALGGIFQQKALEHVRVGDKALINFAALPGRVFESQVKSIPSAIGDSQILNSGALNVIQAQTTSRDYPVWVELPEDFPDHLRKVGLAAQIYIHTEDAGIVAPVAIASQWINTSLDTIR